ncbi:hypothetical protein FOA52_012328 [Chlamydomonas sp. UWO 241]|nr:hypothetical protein FOA52_012328 [Chlamydomonas sp. UWO 241]
MQFQKTLSSVVAAKAEAVAAGEHATRHTLLSMYAASPIEDISLDEFERLALERLRVLKGIEDLRLRGKTDAELQAKSRELTDKHLKGSSNRDTSRMDTISHFILRLAYCSRPELRRWFLTQECELFKVRFLSLLESAGDRAAFLQRENLDYSPVPPSELTPALLEKLRRVQLATFVSDAEAAGDGGGGGGGAPAVYRVPFTAVPDLVAQRKVYLQDGWAYVWQKDLASLVVQDFRAGLSKGLSSVNRRWREIFPDSDARLRPLVEGLSTRYLGPDLGASVAGARRSDLNVTNLPAVSARHFPLCMNTLMGALRKEHHLRHGGRQQLSLFLKSVGLPLEEATVFVASCSPLTAVLLQTLLATADLLTLTPFLLLMLMTPLQLAAPSAACAQSAGSPLEEATSVGLPLEEAMVFWRQEFAPRTPADKFDKEYAYGIRHNYGKEGKMADYTAHNCVTIIRMAGGPDDHHGCPYRRNDEASLRAQLASLRHNDKAGSLPA